MKKINLTSKAKKSIIITGSALVCVAVVAIALHMGGVTAAAEPQSIASSSPSTSAVISVPPIIPQDSEAESQVESTFTPSSGSSKATELTKIEKPTSAPPAPSAASGTNLTDKTKKPSYTSKPTAKSKSTTSAKPKNGTVKDGKTYVDGFGWVDGTGAGGQGTTVGKPGDELTGNKVGVMD
jgi:hypothetical protein